MKPEIVADGAGVPLGLAVAAANVAETALLEPALDAVPVELPPQTPLIADRGYVFDPLRDRLEARGLRPLFPHRQNRQNLKNCKKPSRNDGRRMRRCRRRWKIERIDAWLHAFRRLVNRHEYHSFIDHGWASLACTRIALRG